MPHEQTVPKASWLLRLAICAVLLRASHAFTGHKFGYNSNSRRVEELGDLDIDAGEFFRNYVGSQDGSRPLVVRGAATPWAALSTWADDEYFLARDEVREELVEVETAKKEVREQPGEHITLGEFLGRYEEEPLYVVSPVPSSLRGDVHLPRLLACSALLPHLLIDNMWMSSGGTSSVIHMDAADNMHCVVAGTKRVVMVSPETAAHHHRRPLVIIDRVNGLYSSLDPDNVPDALAEVETLVATLHPGDCVYIPYRWIHQVRADPGRSISVNLWWAHYPALNVSCAGPDPLRDSRVTLDTLRLVGFDAFMEDPRAAKDHFLMWAENFGEYTKARDGSTHRGITSDIVYKNTFVDPDDPLEDDEYEEELAARHEISWHLHQILAPLDADNNGLVTEDEVIGLTDERLSEAHAAMLKMEEFLKTLDDPDDAREDIGHDEL